MSFAFESNRTATAPAPTGPEAEEAARLAVRDRREEWAFRFSPLAALVAVALAWWVAPSLQSRDVAIDDQLPPVLSVAVPKGVTLVVVDGEDCAACRAFYRDVVPSYRYSEYGTRVPIRTLGLRDQSISGFQFKYPARAVPSFILVGPDDVEVDRMDVYPGTAKEFYVALDRMLLKIGTKTESSKLWR